jgi:hypothetical protein
MSDADDQMGGTGGETGPRPGQEKPTGTAEPSDAEKEVDEESEQSFPASDPPGSY